jgi:uncharacterized protein (TIGR00296 family)
MRKKFVLLLLMMCIISIATCSVAATVATVILTPSKLARLAVESYFNNNKLATDKITLADSVNKKPRGVFVTILASSNKSKGCWGSLYPQTNVKESIANAAIDAATKDYRTGMLKKNELKSLKLQVSIVEGISPVNTTRAINPFKDGILVRAGGKSGVILPGEAVDSYYQMVMAKLKAGIQPKEKCEMFKLVVRTYKE